MPQTISRTSLRVQQMPSPIPTEGGTGYIKEVEEVEEAELVD